MRILFMGTPEFAVASLAALLEAGQEIVGVVTAPDKPAGRGRLLQAPAVKKYAEEQDLNILQPEKLKSAGFLARLKKLDPDLIVVVAFRMLPEEVWSFPPQGTINLHASLLPHYRGAAPINRVIMNGETETGITTFYIEKEIDTGKIILQEKMEIGPDETAGELHDRIKTHGASLLVKTVQNIESGKAEGISQSDLIKPGDCIMDAPKIQKEDCRIIWDRRVQRIYNQVRGLSPYPAAWTTLVSPDGDEKILKIYRAETKDRDSMFPAGTLMSDGKNRMEVVCKKGILNLKEVQLEGKKRMEISEFCRGFPGLESCTVK